MKKEKKIEKYKLKKKKSKSYIKMDKKNYKI